MVPLSASLSNPSNWPAIPFHKGEVFVQKLMGSHDHVMSYAPKFIRSYMPDQHRAFYTAQPFLVIAARDAEGAMWSTLLPAKNITSPNPQTLDIQGRPVFGDALEHALVDGTDLGILGIEFATKRRNRVNGRLVQSNANDKLTFKVDQSFGNCPQYIKPRQWWWANDLTNDNESAATTTNSNKQIRPNHLSDEQIAKIRQAETIFVATGYRDTNAGIDDPRLGNDASHRGGPAGFVHVQDSRTLILPDFSGNNHYNTIGNLIEDDKIGISFPQYETGAMIQISGSARVNFDANEAAAFYPGAERLIVIQIDQVNELAPNSIPIRWTTDTAELQERSLVVSSKIQESADVMSFHLRPRENELQSLWEFTPGQHLPLVLDGVDPLKPNASVERTYSISAGPDWGEYRISVKRQGLASNFLHDHVQVGDSIRVLKPSGDFVLDNLASDNGRPIVFLSNGIGVTPLISMLHHWANSVSSNKNRRHVYWVHGARDSKHHSFTAEIEEIQHLVKTATTSSKDMTDDFRSSLLTTHIAYSQPLDVDEHLYDSQGRLSAKKLAEIVPDILAADIYMCGTDAFVADMEQGLTGLIGVPTNQIHYETF